MHKNKGIITSYLHITILFCNDVHYLYLYKVDFGTSILVKLQRINSNQKN